MTPIRETIARAIFETYVRSDIRADWAEGVTWAQFLSWSADTVSERPRSAVDAYIKTVRDEADAVLRALDEAGYVVAPKEPSEAMIEAHFEAHAQAAAFFADVPDVWRAMISAAVVE